MLPFAESISHIETPSGTDLNHWYPPKWFIVLFYTLKEINFISTDHEKYIFIPDSWLIPSDAYCV